MGFTKNKKFSRKGAKAQSKEERKTSTTQAVKSCKRILDQSKHDRHFFVPFVVAWHRSNPLRLRAFA
jgi:hypothetical protein